jgi:hypothetical protein
MHAGTGTSERASHNGFHPRAEKILEYEGPYIIEALKIGQLPAALPPLQGYVNLAGAILAVAILAVPYWQLK